MDKYLHSINLDKDKCMGCTNCMKPCPTQAIRIRDGKAQIIAERCIDCGECIKICPYHAKLALTDSIEKINNFKYKVALPDISFYGQFKDSNQVNNALLALKNIGFDFVFEINKVVQFIENSLKQTLQDKDIKKPLITSTCPAVVRLIQIRFPELIENIAKIDMPMEMAARIVKDILTKDKKIKTEDIGVFLISPCAAKATEIRMPIGGVKSAIDGVFPIKEIYKEILPIISKNESNNVIEFDLNQGVRWGCIGGEVVSLNEYNCLAVDGIRNVIDILDKVENDKLSGIDYIELASCTCGCVGGPLTIENPYIAKNRIRKLSSCSNNEISFDYDITGQAYNWEKDLEYIPALKIDTNITLAMQKVQEMNNIRKELPGIDCGSCGAPTCAALAEDIVRGTAKITDCVFKR